MFLIKAFDSIGSSVLSLCNEVGNSVIFLAESTMIMFTTRLKLQKLFAQMEHIGVNSISIVILTGTFAGAVLALQTYTGFKRFGAEEYLGPVVALTMTRELGPVMAALMVTGRAGSSITAELATMRITEQIDALKTLCINSYQYLIVPRMLASLIMMPLLALFAIFFGIVGGYAIAVLYYK